MLGRLLLAVMVVFAIALATVTVWGNIARASGDGASATAEAPAPASVVLQPAPGATGVSPRQPVTVRPERGRLVDVALVGPDGVPVPGSVGGDGAWHATTPTAYATSYTYRGSVVDGAGRSTPITGGFTTADPAQQLRARINIGDGATVGVAAPIVVQFSGHVTDEAAAERALHVQTSVPTTGSWAWLPDDDGGSRVHWRPKDYWTPGTQVALTADLLGVDYGDGAWGAADVTSHFTIGRSQIVKADVRSHEMVVVRDGQTVMTLPASYGLGSDPNRNTTNGIHVVMDKDETVLMSNPAYGYENVPEHWAVRISNNGEFIHANPATDGVQGSANVTHGCVNLSTADARAYFATALVGDPVEVTGSPVPMPEVDVYDWTLDWPAWQQLSALPAA